MKRSFLLAILLLSLALAMPLTEAANATLVYISGSGTCDGTTNYYNCPKIRFFNSTGYGQFSNETELPTAGSPIIGVVIRYSNVSAKRIIITHSRDLNLDAYVSYNNTDWTVTNNIANTSRTWTAKPYDLAFETITGNAMLVYAPLDYSDGCDLAYKILLNNDTNWGNAAGGCINDTTPAGAAGTRRDLNYSWIHMNANPLATSQELVMAGFDMNNSDIVAYIWNGTIWGHLNQFVGAPSTTTGQGFDVRYAADGSKAMAAAGTGVNGEINTTYWNGYTWTYNPLVNLVAGTDDVAYLNLKADPLTDDLQVITNSNANEISTSYWNGANWKTPRAPDLAMDTTATRAGDFAWNGTSSSGTVVLDTDTTGNKLQNASCTPECSTNTTSTIATISAPNGGAWLSLYTVPPDSLNNATILGIRANSSTTGPSNASIIVFAQYTNGSFLQINDTSLPVPAYISRNTTIIASGSEPWSLDFQKSPENLSIPPAVRVLQALPAKLLNLSILNVTANVTNIDEHPVHTVTAEIYAPNGSLYQTLILTNTTTQTFTNATEKFTALPFGNWLVSIYANNSRGTLNNTENATFAIFINLNQSMGIAIDGAFSDWDIITNITDSVYEQLAIHRPINGTQGTVTGNASFDRLPNDTTTFYKPSGAVNLTYLLPPNATTGTLYLNAWNLTNSTGSANVTVWNFTNGEEYNWYTLNRTEKPQNLTISTDNGLINTSGRVILQVKPISPPTVINITDTYISLPGKTYDFRGITARGAQPMNASNGTDGASCIVSNDAYCGTTVSEMYINHYQAIALENITALTQPDSISTMKQIFHFNITERAEELNGFTLRWVGFSNGATVGVYIFDVNNNTWYPITIQTPTSTTLPTPYVYSVMGNANRYLNSTQGLVHILLQSANSGSLVTDYVSLSTNPKTHYDLREVRLANNQTHLFAFMKTTGGIDFHLQNQYYRLFLSTNESTGNPTTPDSGKPVPFNWSFRVQVNNSACTIFNITNGTLDGCAFSNNSNQIELQVPLTVLGLSIGQNINATFETGSATEQYDIAPAHASFLSYTLNGSLGKVIAITGKIEAVRKDDTSINVSQTGQSGIREIILRNGTQGNYTLLLNVNFTQDLNLSNLTTSWDPALRKALVFNTTLDSNVVNKSLLIPRNNNGEVTVRLCPHADSIANITPGCGNMTLLTLNDSGSTTVNGFTIRNITIDGQQYFVIENVTGTGGEGGADISAPNVTQMNVSPQKALNGTVLNVSVNATDANGNVSQVLAHLYLPDGTRDATLNLSKRSGGNIFYNDTYIYNGSLGLNNFGSLYFTFNATDNSSNSNDTERQFFYPYVLINQSGSITIDASFSDWDSIRSNPDPLLDTQLNYQKAYFRPVNATDNNQAHFTENTDLFEGIDLELNDTSTNTELSDESTITQVNYTYNLTDKTTQAILYATIGKTGAPTFTIRIFNWTRNAFDDAFNATTTITANQTNVSQAAGSIRNNGEVLLQAERIGSGTCTFSDTYIEADGWTTDYRNITASSQAPRNATRLGTSTACSEGTNEYCNSQTPSEISQTDYAALTNLNAVYATVSTTLRYAGHVFHFNISDSREDVAGFTVQWSGQWTSSESTPAFGAYLWNGSNWEPFQRNTTPEDKRNLLYQTKSQTRDNIANYIDRQNLLHMLLQEDNGVACSTVCNIKTDYVQLNLIYNKKERVDIESVKITNNNTHLFAYARLNQSFINLTNNTYIRMFLSVNENNGNNRTPDTQQPLPFFYQRILQINQSLEKCEILNETNGSLGTCQFANASNQIEISAPFSLLNLTLGNNTNATFETGSISKRYDTAPSALSFLSYGINGSAGGAAAAATCDKPLTGDWNVNSTQVCTNQVINLTGNLTINGTGNLTFHNVTLILNVTYNGSNSINVSGTWFVNQSNITDINYTTNYLSWQYALRVHSQANFTMIHSQVSRVGWAQNVGEYGFEINTTVLNFTNNTITDNFVGVLFFNQSTARDLASTGQLMGIWVQGHGMIITHAFGNTSSPSGNGIRIAADNGTYNNLTGLANTSYGIIITGANNNILTNSFGHSITDIGLYLSTNGNGNNVTHTFGNSTSGTGIFIEGSHNLLNNVTGRSNTSSGINLGNSVTNTTLANSFGHSLTGQGIYFSSGNGNNATHTLGNSTTGPGIEIDTNTNNLYNITGLSNNSQGILFSSTAASNQLNFSVATSITGNAIWLTSSANGNLFTNVTANSNNTAALQVETNHSRFHNVTAISNNSIGFLLNASAFNNTLNYTYSHSEYGTGLYLTGDARNNNISHSTGNSTRGAGVRIDSRNNTFMNLTALTQWGSAVQFSYTNATRIIDLTARAPAGTGVYLTYSNNITILGGTINASNGLNFTDTSNDNNFIDVNLTNTSASLDVMMRSTGSGLNVNMTFLNVTFRKTNITYSCTGTCTLNVKWWLNLNVSATNQTTSVTGANVNISDINLGRLYSGTTDSNGKIPAQNLTEYTQTATGTTYFTNHTLNASLPNYGFAPTNQTLNLTSSMYAFLTLAPFYITSQSASFLNRTNASIQWATSDTGNSTVRYGLYNSSNLNETMSNSSHLTLRNLTFGGLAPNQTYYYNLTSCTTDFLCVTNGTFTFNTLNNSAPNNVTLDYPVSGDTTFTNRTPHFNWTNYTNPLDPDYDSVRFHFQLCLDEPCTSVIEENTSITNNIYYRASELDFTTYYWRIQVNDSFGTLGNWSNASNFTLVKSVDINLTTNQTLFGTLNLSESNDTSDGSPSPFLVNNIGNFEVNLSLNSTALWKTVGMNTSNYMYKSNDTATCSNCYDRANSITTYRNMSSAYLIMFLNTLNHTLGKNRAAVDINITAPVNEPPGEVTGLVTLQAVNS